MSWFSVKKLLKASRSNFLISIFEITHSLSNLRFLSISDSLGFSGFEKILRIDVGSGFWAASEEFAKSDSLDPFDHPERRNLLKNIMKPEGVIAEKEAKTIGDAISEQEGWESIVGEDSLDAISEIVTNFQVIGAELVEQWGPSILGFFPTSYPSHSK